MQFRQTMPLRHDTTPYLMKGMVHFRHSDVISSDDVTSA